MDLEVQQASVDHIDFAWQIYSPYVKSNLFSGMSGVMSPDQWVEDTEYQKFRDSWDQLEQFIITVDEGPIGWISISRSDSQIQIDNVMIAPEWRGRKVASTIFSALSNQWQKEGLVVRANILDDAEFTGATKRVAEKSGFLEQGQSGLSTIFQLN